jgi:hypothetical protein
MVWPITRARTRPRTTSRAVDIGRAPQSRQFRPALERLEDRLTPSLTIALQEAGVNGGARTVVATTATDFSVVSFTGTYGDFDVRVVGGASDNGATLSDLLSSTTRVTNNSGTAATLNMFVTQTNYTLPTGPKLNVESGLGGSVNAGNLGLSNIFQAWADKGNNAFGMSDFTNGPQSAVQNGSTIQTGSVTGVFTRLATSYSITSLASFTLNGGGVANYSDHVNVTQGQNPVTPQINTSQDPASGTIGTVLNDNATLSGGNNPTGTISFRLYAPGNTLVPVYTDVVTVSGNGTYHTATQGNNSGGYAAQVTGTYQWVATYTSGDSNNNNAASNLGDEPVVISTGALPRTIGYWKNHETSTDSGGYFLAPDGTHITSVTLGGATYTADQADAIMLLSISGGNALLQLFDQLVAYRLNLTMGSVPTAAAIAAAADGDAAIIAASVAAGAPTSKIVVSSGAARWAKADGTSSGIAAFVQASTTLGQEMVDDASALATFNQSGL